MKFFTFIMLFFLFSNCDCVFKSNVIVIDDKTKRPIENVYLNKSKNDNFNDSLNNLLYSDINGEMELNLISGICDEKQFIFKHKKYETKVIILKNNTIDTVLMTIKPNYVSHFFNSDFTFTIFNVKKNKNFNYRGDSLVCNDWGLSQKSILQILITKKSNISNGFIHYHFDHLSCSIIGKLKQSNKEYEFEINAGSWWRISNSDTTLFFGDLNIKHENLFLSSIFVEDLN